MNQTNAIQRLMAYAREGRHVFTKRDLAKVFPEDSVRALDAGLNRLVRNGILVRAANGIYVYALSSNKPSHMLEQIAKAMRRGEYNYVSLESALSEYGVISQIPVDRLTVMTTGRKGEYRTPFGTIEFTHTARAVPDIISSINVVGRPLKLADKQKAYRDLKRVGRNTHLVDERVLNENN